MRFLTVVLAVALVSQLHAADRVQPLMRQLMGLNGHTVQFKPKLYAPIARNARDYHPVGWDVGKETSAATKFPFAANGVDWSKVYGSWRDEGWRVDACLLFDDIEAAQWKDFERDAGAYGEAFARAFGPGGKGLVESVEIGNEPGKYSDQDYAKLFKGMAEGVRRGDSQLKIATCAANLGPSGRYSKSVDALQGMESLYDIVNIHLYAEVEGWPTWRRSFPEDPAIEFREHLRDVLKWRAEHAPDKEVWLTEFGWDASTKPAPATGTFAKWQGSTETQQAQWIVRAWLMFAREGVDRAYLYFFNDDDTPHVHGSSGLTRNFEPKPSFHAAAWLYKSLGDYRFKRVIQEDLKDAYIYEFVHESADKSRIWAVWKPSGAASEKILDLKDARLVRAEQMPLTTGPVGDLATTIKANGTSFTVPIGETPLFLWIE